MKTILLTLILAAELFSGAAFASDARFYNHHHRARSHNQREQQNFSGYYSVTPSVPSDRDPFGTYSATPSRYRISDQRM